MNIENLCSKMYLDRASKLLCECDKVHVKKNMLDNYIVLMLIIW